MDNPIRFTDPDGMGSYDSEGQWHSEMEGFYNYHNFSSAYRPKSFSQNTGDGSGEGNGGGGSGGPGLIETITNFITGLFSKKEEGAGITTYLPGAAVTRAPLQLGVIEGAFETAVTWEEVLAAAGTIARGGQWAIPLMLNGDSSHARGYDIPLTGATDVTADEPDPNLYLYRIMKNEGGFPKVGDGLDKLGLRDRDVNKLPNSTRISTFFGNGLSVSVGYGNNIPANVPDFTDGKGTLFRVQASSLIFYGLVGVPIPKPDNPYYGQIRPAVPMNVGTFRALIRSSAPAWQPVK